MEVIRDPEQWVTRQQRGHQSDSSQPPEAQPHALTIGVFDGVHLGHQFVIGRVREIAERLSIKSALVTFYPHPAQLLRPDIAPPLLTGLSHKLELLETTGLDTVVVVPFDHNRAAESAERFVHSILLDCLAAKAIVVGEDFHFGKGRLGNVDLLTELGQGGRFEVHGQTLVPRPDEPGADGAPRVISSTAIRRALVEGDVHTAAVLLGRSHEVRGEVVAGDQRGRTIGFPTANVLVAPNTAIPGDGVYAGWYVLPDGSRWASAINVGRRPTFYEHAEHSLIEAHLIGFSGDLYGQRARVQFVTRLRAEQKFEGIDQLKDQLTIDISSATKALSDSA